MKNKIDNALCDAYDIQKTINLHKLNNLPKDNEGTIFTISDCIENIILILEELEAEEVE